MRYAVFSDIHGNLDALQAVLEDSASQNVQAYVCLGDIVGYGPQPGECLRELQKYECTIVAGNHDFALCGRVSISGFNAFAREAMVWTRSVLSPSDIEFLARLPLAEQVDGMHVVHGTLYAPELFDYLQTSYDAYLSMGRMEGSICFIGHSHVPVTFVEKDVIGYRLDSVVRLENGSKVIVNVGSVGQPRDKDPRACYAVYDSDQREARIRRVRYDIEAVVRKVRDAGLPAALGERLRVGR